MLKQSRQKLKIMYVADMLMKETDDDHGLTMPQIIERLAEQGIKAERKSIYDDFAALREFGLDVITRKGAATEYAIGARAFEFPELLLLVDAVQSSRFLTEKKSNALVEHIKTLASKHQAEQLSRRVYVEGRIKMQNESIYYNVDAIQEALQQKRKISFQYFEYDLDKKKVLRHGGARYIENPVCLVYSDEYYYLIVYNDAHSDFAHYRVDRMEKIRVDEAPATRNEAIATFDVQNHCAQAFSMYSGGVVAIELLAHRDIMGAVIDRFGKDVHVVRVDGEWAKVHAVVQESGVFYGWLAQFGAKMRIEKPEDVAVKYRSHLSKAIRCLPGRQP